MWVGESVDEKRRSPEAEEEGTTHLSLSCIVRVRWSVWGWVVSQSRVPCGHNV